MDQALIDSAGSLASSARRPRHHWHRRNRLGQNRRLRAPHPPSAPQLTAANLRAHSHAHERTGLPNRRAVRSPGRHHRRQVRRHRRRHGHDDPVHSPRQKAPHRRRHAGPPGRPLGEHERLHAQDNQIPGHGRGGPHPQHGL